MQASTAAQPEKRHEALRFPTSDRVPRLACELARAVADSADADQWAIAVVGLKDTGPPDFEELAPRPWLETLNAGGPARYRMTWVLRAGDEDLGILRLGTVRPHGFCPDDVAAARLAVGCASKRLRSALGRRRQRQ